MVAGLPHQDSARHHDPSQSLGSITRVSHHLRVSALNRDADFSMVWLAQRNREITCVFAASKVVFFNILG